MAKKIIKEEKVTLPSKTEKKDIKSVKSAETKPKAVETKNIPLKKTTAPKPAVKPAAQEIKAKAKTVVEPKGKSTAQKVVASKAAPKPAVIKTVAKETKVAAKPVAKTDVKKVEVKPAPLTKNAPAQKVKAEVKASKIEPVKVVKLKAVAVVKEPVKASGKVKTVPEPKLIEKPVAVTKEPVKAKPVPEPKPVEKPVEPEIKPEPVKITGKKGKSGSKSDKPKERSLSPLEKEEIIRQQRIQAGLIQEKPEPAPDLAKKQAALKAQETNIIEPVNKPNVRYSDEDLEGFRERIMDVRKEALEELGMLKERLEDLTNYDFAEESMIYSMHMAEQGSEAMEKEKTYAQIQRINEYLKKLDEALQRIHEKTYGICRVCGCLIAKERLWAVPITTLSASYKIHKKCPEDGLDLIEPLR